MDLLTDVMDEPRIASIKSRIAAGLIDFSIIVAIEFAIGYFWGDFYTNEAGNFEVNLDGWPALVWFVIVFGLISVQEGLTGKTIGKRVLRIRVLRRDYTERTVIESIVRHLFDVVDCFFLIGIFVAMGNGRKQRIGDLVAKTVVVED